MKSDFAVHAGESLQESQALYSELRARCPVAHTDALGGFWALTRHADVVRAASDFAAFSTTVQNVVPKIATTGRRPPLHFDPPQQTPYRAALNPLLSAERIAPLEAAIRAIVREELQPMLARGYGDICKEFASRFPVRVFGHWMQLDDVLQAQLMRAGPAFIQAVQAFDKPLMQNTSLVLYDMARQLIAQRKQTPKHVEEDPVSALLAVRIAQDGVEQPLPDELIVGTVRQVLVVGIVAPMVMVGSMAVHLAAHPDLHQQLKGDGSLMGAAVEEFLRLYTPYRGFARTAVNDIVMGGRTIPAGDPVALTYASANRDEAVFDDPHTFRLHRANIAEHVGFGRGPHYCAGAHLARLELRVVLEELIAATQRVDIAGEVLYCPYPEIGPYQVPLKLQVRVA